MQFGEQLWLKREPRLWRAPSRPNVLAQYLLLRRRGRETDAKKTDEKIEKSTVGWRHGDAGTDRVLTRTVQRLTLSLLHKSSHSIFK